MKTQTAESYIEKRNEKLPGGERWRNLDFAVWFLKVLAIALCIRAVIVEPVRVKGSSMVGTLQDGDYMLVDKLTYTVSDMKRGDIIICFYPQNDEYSCVKRVIGLPGETVAIYQGQVYINGVELREDGLYHITGEPLREDYLTETVNSRHDGVWTVEEGTVFVLGDNRKISRDSSSVGCVPVERVKGRVRCRLWPFGAARTFEDIAY